MWHRWGQELRERWPVQRFHALIIPQDANHHLHLSCFNSFMTANVKKTFQCGGNNPSGLWRVLLGVCRWHWLSTWGVFLALKCLRRWLFQASYLNMPPHSQLNPKRSLPEKGSLLNLHAKHLESSHKWGEHLFPSCSFSFHDSNTDHCWLPG